jgi:hypothetical protein
MMATINNIASRKDTSGGHTDDGGSNKHSKVEEKTVLKQRKASRETGRQQSTNERNSKEKAGTTHDK